MELVEAVIRGAVWGAGLSAAWLVAALVWPHENHELPKLGGQFAVICDHECTGGACCLRIEVK